MWKDKAQSIYDDTKIALQTLYDSINKGQQKQLVKISEIKQLLDRYGVSYEN